MGRSDDIARFFDGDTSGHELFERVDDDEVGRWLARAWEAAGTARGARSADEQPGRR